MSLSSWLSSRCGRCSRSSRSCWLLLQIKSDSRAVVVWSSRDAVLGVYIEVSSRVGGDGAAGFDGDSMAKDGKEHITVGNASRLHLKAWSIHGNDLRSCLFLSFSLGFNNCGGLLFFLLGILLNKCLYCTNSDRELGSEVEIELWCTYDNRSGKRSDNWSDNLRNRNLDWSYFNRGLVEERRLHDKLGSLISDSLSVDVWHDDIEVLSIGVFHVDAGQALLALKLRGNAVSIGTAAKHGVRVELRF